MSVIEGSRKVLQDFIAPELRAIDARLTGLEQGQKQNDIRSDQFQRQVDRRFEDLQHRMDRLEERFDRLLHKIDSLINYQDLQVRMTRLETLSGVAGAETKAQKPKVSEPEAA